MPSSKIFGRTAKIYGANAASSTWVDVAAAFSSATLIGTLPIGFVEVDGNTGAWYGKNYLFDTSGNFVISFAHVLDTVASQWQLSPLVFIDQGIYTGKMNLSEAVGLFPNSVVVGGDGYDYYYVTDDDLDYVQVINWDAYVGFRKGNPSQLVRSAAYVGTVVFGLRSDPTITQSWTAFVTDAQTGRLILQSSMTSGTTHQRNSWQWFAPDYATMGDMTGFAPGYIPPTPDTDPYAGIDGEATIPGGGSIAIPGFPPATATATGIVGLFAPSEAQMRDLADYMWTDFGGQGTTEVDVLKEIVEALKRSISNPLDYVLGLNIIPSQGLSIGASQIIRFGFVSSGVSMPRLSNQYFAVDCGTLHFDPLCGDTFLDYAPYSKFSIYLPYIGAKELDANDCVGHTIGVVYHGDTVTGGVTAYITKDGTVVYQFAGSCALSIPLSSDGWGSTISAAVQIATSIATAGAAAGSAGVARAAAQGAASVTANPSLLSPQVAHSGAVSGAAGCMGIQYPYIIREAVRFHSTAHFNTLTGYPAFYFRALSDVRGYTRVLDVHLSGVPATVDEIAEIETLLKEGVEL